MARQRRKNTVKLANHEQKAKVEKIPSLIARYVDTNMTEKQEGKNLLKIGTLLYIFVSKLKMLTNHV